MPKLDFGAAVRRVILDEVNIRLTPYRELLERLALVIERADALKGSAPSNLKRPAQLALPIAAQVSPLPLRSAAPPQEIVVRRLPPRAARGSGIRAPRAEETTTAPAETKVLAVKPLIRRKAKAEPSDGALEPAFDPLDAKVAKRFFVGQSVRYRAADGLVTAKIAAIDGATGVLTLINPADDSRFVIPASSVFAAV